MAFELLIHIEEDSLRGRVLQAITAEQHVTPEEAALQMLDAGIVDRVKGGAAAASDKTPAEMLMGLFSSPEDAALIEEVTSLAYEGRRAEAAQDAPL